MATYTGAFELRKLHVIWSTQDALVASDDARVCTFHLLKVSGGNPTDAWVAEDFTLVQSTLLTWWGTIKTQYDPEMVLDRMKLYKDGPAIEPPQVPVYDADLNVPGTSSGFESLPPQVAISVTEIAGSKRHWGRFYLPAPTAISLGAYGRLHATPAGTIATATDTWYEALKAGGIHPVVYRAALPVRQTAQEKRDNVTPGSLPARDASAWDVEKIQVDDVLDVIRSRRYKQVVLRTQREVA